MKVNRHTKILELIQKYNIETQEELAEYLNRDGFQVTQATVSRDIRDLKLTKIPTEGGRQKYSVIHHSMDHGINEKYMRILKDGFMSIDVAESACDQDGSRHGNGGCGCDRCAQMAGNLRKYRGRRYDFLCGKNGRRCRNDLCGNGKTGEIKSLRRKRCYRIYMLRI